MSNAADPSPAMPARTTTVSSSGQKPTEQDKPAIDRYLTRAAQCCQVLTFAVVVFGYFYTVQPAFQLADLKEQFSRLSINSRAAETRLADIVATQKAAEAKLTLTRTELLTAEADRKRLTEELSREGAREVAILRRMSATQSTLSSKEATLHSAQRRLLYTRFQGAFAWRALVWGWSRPDPKDTEDKFVSDSEKRWPRPFELITQGLDQIEKQNETSHEFPPDFIRPLREILAKNSSALVCEVADFRSLRRTFQEELSAKQLEAVTKAKASIDEQRRAAEASGRRLLVEEDTLSRFTKANEVWAEYEAMSAFGKRLEELSRHCAEKADPVLKLMEQQIINDQ